MRTLFITCIVMTICAGTFAQGWVGSGTNLFGVNSGLALSPLNVGIGVATPTAQFHTTGSVRFQGLPITANSRVMVTDANGNVSYITPGAPGTVLGVNGFGDLQWGTPGSIAWMLNGNTIGSTEFIGTLNAEHFRLRTNNTEHFQMRGTSFVNSNGRVFPVGTFLFYENPAHNNLFITYGQVLIDKPVSFITNPNATDGLDDGLTIYNSNGDPGIAHRAASLCLGARDTVSSFQSLVSMSGVNMGLNQADIIFKNEFAGPQSMRMTMRIAHTGNVGIGPNAVDLSASPTARLHVDGNVRFENLPTGSGNVLVIDANGYVYRSTCPCREQPFAPEMEDMQAEIDRLKEELSAIKSMLANISGSSAGHAGGAYQVTVFPNPNDGTFQVKFVNNDPTLQNAAVQIILMDAGGKFVYQTDMRIAGTENYKSISDLYVAAGLYTVLFQSQGRILATENVIIK